MAVTHPEHHKPTEPTITGVPDRRASRRLAAEITVRYGQAGQMTPGRGYDLSQTGIGFTGCRLFPLGTTLDIEFSIDASQAEWFKVKGIVLYAKADRMGVEFLDTSAENKTRILKAIRHQQATGRREA